MNALTEILRSRHRHPEPWSSLHRERSEAEDASLVAFLAVIPEGNLRSAYAGGGASL